jgi:hypothetical protein
VCGLGQQADVAAGIVGVGLAIGLAMTDISNDRFASYAVWADRGVYRLEIYLRQRMQMRHIQVPSRHSSSITDGANTDDNAAMGLHQPTDLRDGTASSQQILHHQNSLVANVIGKTRSVEGDRHRPYPPRRRK